MFNEALSDAEIFTDEELERIEVMASGFASYQYEWLEGRVPYAFLLGMGRRQVLYGAITDRRFFATAPTLEELRRKRAERTPLPPDKRIGELGWQNLLKAAEHGRQWHAEHKHIVGVRVQV